jgi:hypothetical protein
MKNREGEGAGGGGDLFAHISWYWKRLRLKLV